MSQHEGDFLGAFFVGVLFAGVGAGENDANTGQDEQCAGETTAVQPFSEKETGKEGGANRLQGKDQGGAIRRCILLRDGLQYKTKGAAQQAES